MVQKKEPRKIPPLVIERVCIMEGLAAYALPKPSR
jgi:hypothetical protein